jgi:hypothetical protein
VDKKIARICWNSEGWQKPSGPVGKSKSTDAYESQTGYGHEEWLLDTTKLIDGYHYGYLQAIGQHREKYLGSEFDISIYSINSKTKQRWWIGEIKNVKIIDGEESRKVYKEYKQNGWYAEMIAQLEAVNADISKFKKNVPPEAFAVIKFRPEDLELLDFPLEFLRGDLAVTSDYYNLKNKKKSPKLLGSEKFNFVGGHNPGKHKATSTYLRQKGEVDLIHNQIQTALFNQLIEIYGVENVETEVAAGEGMRVDLVVKHKNKYSFYEIKTSRSIRQCVRDAIGQLLEYAHYGNTVAIRDFIVVSPNIVNRECLSYLSFIKDKYGIPIKHQEFDLKKMLLSEK